MTLRQRPKVVMGTAIFNTKPVLIVLPSVGFFFLCSCWKIVVSRILIIILLYLDRLEDPIILKYMKVYCGKKSANN